MNLSKLTTMAYGTASKKAFEALYPTEKRLFQDEYTIKLLTPGWRIFSVNIFKNKFLFDRVMKIGDKIAPGVQVGLICRVRYIDEVLKEINHMYVKSHAQAGEGNREGFLELHFTTKSKKKRTCENRIMRALILMTRLLGKKEIEWINLNRDIVK